jgi:demethylmenaquinone methyltransferase / 2-methoxy-6-polyprenyl-1,4-benzoquinol methylase
VLPLQKFDLLTQIRPYKTDDSKKKQVIRMFDNIAGTYDFLNHLLSMGIDKGWRSKALRHLEDINDLNAEILDLATGTCDLAIETVLKYPHVKVLAGDISLEMLAKGEEKIRKKGLSESITTMRLDAEELNLVDNRFDSITLGISEMFRVLKPGGKLIVLEFSQSRVFLVKHIFNFYFKYILPSIGNLLSRDKSAYSYLYESVQHFPDYERFTAILEASGFHHCSYKPLTFGICTIYIGIK